MKYIKEWIMMQGGGRGGGATGQQVSSEFLSRLICFFQSFGEGLAVIPLMGLLESIAIARAFGECVQSEQQDASGVGGAYTPPPVALST